MQTENHVPDILVQLPVTLEELYSGCDKTKSFIRPQWVRDKPFKMLDEITVHIKPGTLNNSLIKLTGKGEQRSNYTSGDVVVHIKQIPHKIFERKGNDLYITREITLKEALIGTPTMHITTLDKRKLNINLKQIIIDPTYEHLVPGEGMPILNKESEHGNLIIKFKIIFPNDLNDEKKQRFSDILDNNFESDDAGIMKHIMSSAMRRITTIIK